MHRHRLQEYLCQDHGSSGQWPVCNACVHQSQNLKVFSCWQPLEMSVSFHSCTQQSGISISFPKSVLVNLDANQEYIVFSLEALINHWDNLSYFSIFIFFIAASENPTRPLFHPALLWPYGQFKLYEPIGVSSNQINRTLNIHVGSAFTLIFSNSHTVLVFQTEVKSVKFHVPLL